jgi:hypothetical protein
MVMRKSRASFSFTWLISVPPPIVGSSLSLSGVRNGVDSGELFLLGMFLGVFERWLNKWLRERRGESEAGLLDGDEDGDETGESLYLPKGKYDAGLSVTQSDDPLSGGHFDFGVSKAPLNSRLSVGSQNRSQGAALTPGPPDTVVE